MDSDRHGSAAGPGRVLGIDLGGTLLRLAVADLDGRFLRTCVEEIDPPAGPPVILRRIIDAGRAALWAQGATRPIAVGLATPGVVDAKRGVVVAARNLRGWREVPVREVLAQGFAAPVTVDNDVNLAAVGERWHGAGRGEDTVVFIAIGTGIGAGILIGGQVHRGAHFAAGEVNALPSGITAEDGRCELALEDVASGPAIVRRAKARGVAPAGGPLTTAQVFALASAGDIAASTVIAEAVDALARGIASLLAGIDPGVIAIGGGVSRQGETLLGPLRRRLQQMVHLRARLLCSELGSDAQLHGAVVAALRLADESLEAVGKER